MARQALNTRHDYRMQEGLQTVTYQQTPENGELVSVQVADCVRYELSHRELMGGQGAFSLFDVAWQVPKEFLPVTPQQGDSITDEDGVLWTVKEVMRQEYDLVWRLVCRKGR